MPHAGLVLPRVSGKARTLDPGEAREPSSNWHQGLRAAAPPSEPHLSP